MSIQLINQVVTKLNQYNFKFKTGSEELALWINDNISTSNSADEEYSKFMQNYQKLNPTAETNYYFTIIYSICKVENKMQFFDTYFRLVTN
jgi:hypothetical protein